MSPLQTATLTARATMETGVVGALSWWGYQAGGTTAESVALAVAAPAVGFGIWGAVDFHQLGRLAEPLRLAEELIISGLAALGLYATGQRVLAGALAALSLGYHALVYLQGDRLLKTPLDDPGVGGARTRRHDEGKTRPIASADGIADRGRSGVSST